MRWHGNAGLQYNCSALPTSTCHDQRASTLLSAACSSNCAGQLCLLHGRCNKPSLKVASDYGHGPHPDLQLQAHDLGLRQLEARSALDGVQQLLAQRGRAPEVGQLQCVAAGGQWQDRGPRWRVVPVVWAWSGGWDTALMHWTDLCPVHLFIPLAVACRQPGHGLIPPSTPTPPRHHHQQQKPAELRQRRAHLQVEAVGRRSTSLPPTAASSEAPQSTCGAWHMPASSGDTPACACRLGRACLLPASYAPCSFKAVCTRT